MLTVLSIGLMVAAPILKTQIQREKEEELIFRGNQYVEAIRLYQAKNPGKYPESLEELIDPDERFIRKLYKDPMSKDGEWKVILLPDIPAAESGQSARTGASKVLTVPQQALNQIRSPKIVGVVSSSREASIRIYLEQETYDRWLFYLGMDPDNFPEIEEYGETEKK